MTTSDSIQHIAPRSEPTTETYDSEDDLVRDFVAALGYATAPWSTYGWGEQFYYRSGRTDLVLLTEQGCLIAIEAKLKNWRQAIYQAYRSTTFAKQSYVLLPKSVALRVASFDEEFSKRSVGLCYIDAGKITVIIEPQDSPPLQPWLRAMAKQHIEENRQCLIPSYKT